MGQFFLLVLDQAWPKTARTRRPFRFSMLSKENDPKGIRNPVFRMKTGASGGGGSGARRWTRDEIITANDVKITALG